MKLTKEVTIRNPLGLHARPASQIAQILKGTSCKVVFRQGERTADAKSVVEILMLAAKSNSSLTIEVEGKDAEAVMKTLIRTFAEDE